MHRARGYTCLTRCQRNRMNRSLSLRSASTQLNWPVRASNAPARYRFWFFPGVGTFFCVLTLHPTKNQKPVDRIDCSRQTTRGYCPPCGRQGAAPLVISKEGDVMATESNPQPQSTATRVTGPFSGITEPGCFVNVADGTLWWSKSIRVSLRP